MEILTTIMRRIAFLFIGVSIIVLAFVGLILGWVLASVIGGMFLIGGTFFFLVFVLVLTVLPTRLVDRIEEHLE